ncbi:MAG: HEPN domain-containing protein [Methylovulum sp.]|nr:HEPN domain-containing protein [Methylovulum sp.]
MYNTEQLARIAIQDGAQYAWLRQSLNDFEMTHILFSANKWDGVCYHAQQSVEKLLKFIISSTGQPIRHTHSVHELAKDCNKLLDAEAFDEEHIDCYKELSQYNTIARNPSACDAPVDIITKKQAQSAIDTLDRALMILEQLYGQK